MNVKEKAYEIIHEHLGVAYDDIKLESDIVDDLGADSLDCVELVMVFEEEFNLTLNDDAIESLKTVQDIIDYLEDNGELVKVSGFDIPSDEEITEAIKTLMIACHGNAWNAGWWHDLESGDVIERDFGTIAALIHSEISEAFEAHRKDLMDDKLTHRKGLPTELHDGLIRIFDYLGRYHMHEPEITAEKMAFNKKRADHKPENRIKEGGKKI